MQLIKVYSNQASFRTVEFNRTGLSFVVAKQKNPEASEKGKTYNGVGKSLLVRIIHFCLGARVKDYKTFCEKLPGWEFFVDFEICLNKYTARRVTDEPEKIFLNNEELSIKKFNNKMSTLCFDIPNGISFLSFRSLIPFFIRPKKESYIAYNRPGKTGSDYQAWLYNVFLLGLDVFLTQKKYDIRKEQERIKELEKNFKKDSLLRDFFTGNKDVALTIVDIEERIKRLDDDLSNFRVAEDYNEVQLEADKVENELFTLSNSVIMLQNNIENISKNLKFSPDMNKEDIKTIYSESKIYFAENMTKTLDDLENFYVKLISNRKRRLLEQQNKLKLEQQHKQAEVERLQKELDKLMQYLGEHQALDLFVSISNKSAELKAERDSLKKYQELQSEYKTKERQSEKNLLELNEVTENYLKEIESDTIELRDYFRSLSKIFYPDSVAGITIENNDGDNQLRFNIDARIESDASDGINNVKIFCYDLTILFKGHNHNINFVFHDSRLFDGTDERQKTDIFKTVYQKFAGVGKQYIATVNQNQLDEIKKYITDEEYKNLITQNTVLTLTDELDSEKLLGIKVDLGEK
ncbi:DUF2326 domain-containing protein [Candidatus Kuenenia sp.]|jgi:uncharacterized protein YydD (DUF2326 family)|uniref:DUF2326 domain-containing protein n=1 Tax=Candidatus Kuenenia sp. TaxID=2499824 RepID=UPI003220654B